MLNGLLSIDRVCLLAAPRAAHTVAACDPVDDMKREPTTTGI
jgi:hypothetical protein